MDLPIYYKNTILQISHHLNHSQSNIQQSSLDHFKENFKLILVNEGYVQQPFGHGNNGLPITNLLNYINQFEGLSLEIIKLNNKVHQNYRRWTADVDGRLHKQFAFVKREDILMKISKFQLEVMLYIEFMNMVIDHLKKKQNKVHYNNPIQINTQYSNIPQRKEDQDNLTQPPNSSTTQSTFENLKKQIAAPVVNTQNRQKTNRKITPMKKNVSGGYIPLDNVFDQHSSTALTEKSQQGHIKE